MWLPALYRSLPLVIEFVRSGSKSPVDAVIGVADYFITIHNEDTTRDGRVVITFSTPGSWETNQSWAQKPPTLLFHLVDEPVSTYPVRKETRETVPQQSILKAD